MLVFGIDVIMVDLKELMEVSFVIIVGYMYVLVFFYDYLCDLCVGELGVDWIGDV